MHAYPDQKIELNSTWQPPTIPSALCSSPEEWPIFLLPESILHILLTLLLVLFADSQLKFKFLEAKELTALLTSKPCLSHTDSGLLLHVWSSHLSTTVVFCKILFWVRPMALASASPGQTWAIPKGQCLPSWAEGQKSVLTNLAGQVSCFSDQLSFMPPATWLRALVLDSDFLPHLPHRDITGDCTILPGKHPRCQQPDACITKHTNLSLNSLMPQHFHTTVSSPTVFSETSHVT